jgi:hypothetical protein
MCLTVTDCDPATPNGFGAAGKGAGNGTRTRGLNLGKVACYHYTMPAGGNTRRMGQVEAVPSAGAFKCSNGGGERQSGGGVSGRGRGRASRRCNVPARPAVLT